MSKGIKVELEGEEELAAALDKVLAAVTGPQLEKGLEAGYLVWEGEAKVLIQTSPATGKQYGRHQASAPGEPPATDSGNLVNDWPPPVGSGSGSNVSVEGGPGADYAAKLELGTKKMAPRPFMRPALDEGRTKIAQAVTNVLSKFVNKAAS